MKPLRVGVIGAGRLGGFHAQKLAARDDVRLVAVADPVPAQRKRVAAECRTRAAADYREFFDEVDAVVVAAPSRLHHGIGVDFLRRGIHVLMEKPLATSTADADELVASARHGGAVLQVGHVERFNPALAAAMPHLDRPKYIEAVRAGPFTFRSTDIGVVLDLMIHDIDLVLSMVHARVERVEAIGLSVLGGHEDVANARIHFADGAVAALSASRVAYEQARRMQVWTARAFASIDFAERSTTVVRPSESLLQRGLDLDALSPESRQHLMEDHLPRTRHTAEAVDALALEIDDFLASIRGPRSPRVTGEQGREAVAVCEQVLAALQTHAWDDSPDAPVGPLLIPRPRLVPVPHFEVSGITTPVERKRAG